VKVWLEILHAFYWIFISIFSIVRILKNPSIIGKVIAMSLVCYFLGHCVLTLPAPAEAKVGGDSNDIKILTEILKYF